MIGLNRPAAHAMTVALVAVALLVGCSSSKSGGGGSSAPAPASTGGGSSGGTSANDLLPADVKSRGYITIAEEVDYPPLVSAQGSNTNLVGADIDLRKELEPVLGIKIKQQIMAFDAYIPALQAGKVDLLGTIIGDLPERRQVADFIDYMAQGNAVLVKSDSTVDVSSMDALCGLKLGSTAGSNTVPLMDTQDKACKQAGKPAIKQQIFNTQPDGIVAVRSGRSDGFFLPTLSGGYIAAQSDGALKLGPAIGPTTPAGWVVIKGSPLEPALLAAFKELYDNGTLKTVYDKYGIADGLSEPQLNEAPAS